MKRRGVAFYDLEQELTFHYHSCQPGRISDNIRGQTGSNLSFVDLELPEEVKDDTEDTKKIQT